MNKKGGNEATCAPDVKLINVKTLLTAFFSAATPP